MLNYCYFVYLKAVGIFYMGNMPRCPIGTCKKLDSFDVNKDFSINKGTDNFQHVILMKLKF